MLRLSFGLKRPDTSLLRELGAVAEVTRVRDRCRVLRTAPRGREQVVVAPGFLTGAWVTWPLRRSLASLGHQVHDWGLGRNDGDVRALLPRLNERVRALAQQHGPQHLVGWSLGGFMLREVAREQPQNVIQVVTMASPIVGGAKYTAAARYYSEWVGVDLDAVEQEIAQRDSVPIQVPVLAMYDPNDGIVCPGACFDRVNPYVRHLPVACGHAGFGFSPEVLALLARQLVDPAYRPNDATSVSPRAGSV